VGDRVVLKVEASALARNVGSLVGFPVLFLALGWVISLFLGNTVLLGLPITFFCLLQSPLGSCSGCAFVQALVPGKSPDDHPYYSDPAGNGLHFRGGTESEGLKKSPELQCVQIFFEIFANAGGCG